MEISIFTVRYIHIYTYMYIYRGSSFCVCMYAKILLHRRKISCYYSTFFLFSINFSILILGLFVLYIYIYMKVHAMYLIYQRWSERELPTIHVLKRPFLILRRKQCIKNRITLMSIPWSLRTDWVSIFPLSILWLTLTEWR